MPRPKPPIPPQPFPPVPPQPPIVPPPGYNTYIGMRYVPLICGPFDPQRAYEPLSVVAYGFQSFTSLTYVPAGITPDNEQYWVLTGDYVAQFKIYSEELNQLEARMETISTDETEQNNKIANLTEGLATATEAIQDNSKKIVDVQKNVTALDAKVDENDNNQTAALNQAKADIAANINTLTNTVNQNKIATDNAIAQMSAELSADLTDAERDLTNLINETSQQTKLDYQAADNILSGKIDDLQTDTNDKLANVNSKISANTSAIADTKNMVQTLETNTNANFSTVNQKILSAEQEIDALQSKDTAHDSEITLLKAGLSDANTDISNVSSQLAAEITNRTNSDTAITNRVNALETAVDDRDNDIAALKTSQQEQDVKISELTEQVEINTQDISALQTTTATHTTQIGDLTTEVDTLEQSVDSLSDNVTANNTEIAGLKTDTDKLEDKYNMVDARISMNEDNITQNTNDIDSLKSGVITNTTSISQIKSTNTIQDKKISSLETKTTNQASEIAGIQTDVNNNMGDIAALQGDVAKLNTKTYLDLSSLLREDLKNPDAAEHLATLRFEKYGAFISCFFELQPINLTGNDIITTEYLPEIIRPSYYVSAPIMGRNTGSWNIAENYITDLVIYPSGQISIRTGINKDKISILSGTFVYITNL